MTFPPGTYYVGDPGFVLPNDDLRMLFEWTMSGTLKSGVKEIEESWQIRNGQPTCDYYWSAVTPQKSGTVYDSHNKGWGFDWGSFGVVPCQWMRCLGSYETNKIEFTEPFECSFTEDSITIGHLHFTFNPK